ncbi:Uncharacterized protein Adt_02487 [Abeliophyllum distichum]|uniref:Uncharacterized protein n=1 Tax=Abeliophyllum distichum TaxID=126358 RepID=A0ABD1VVT8_9LAMI
MFNTPFVLSFALLLSFPLLFFFAPRFLPPKHAQISLPDELDDLALFRRATLASLRPGACRLPFRHHQFQFQFQAQNCLLVPNQFRSPFCPLSGKFSSRTTKAFTTSTSTLILPPKSLLLVAYLKAASSPQNALNAPPQLSSPLHAASLPPPSLTTP